MCTVTIHHGENRLLVTMNRDEMLARGREKPPAVYSADDGPDWVAPIDSDAGGTWMGANDQGVVCCLLNAYLPEDAKGPLVQRSKLSRGLIIPEALKQGGYEQITDWTRSAFDPAPYSAFWLLILSKDAGVRILWHKDHGLEEWPINGSWTMITSALFFMEEVREYREQKFAEWLEDEAPMAGHLPSFHLIQEPGKEDWAPLVQRDWASTRSITQAVIGPDDRALEMRHWRHPTIHGGLPSSSVTLPLAHHAER